MAIHPKTCRRKNQIGAINLTRIGEGAKRFFPQKLVRSGKGSKYEENEYKSSLGGLRQKLIGALNSARIGGDVKPKRFQSFYAQSSASIRDCVGWSVGLSVVPSVPTMKFCKICLLLKLVTWQLLCAWGLE
jgi:hypothetical protein